MSLVVFFSLVCVPTQATDRGGHDQAVWILVESRTALDTRSVRQKRQAIAALRSASGQHGPDALATLLGTLRDDRAFEVRKEALDAACALASPADVRAIVDTVHGMIAEMTQADLAGNELLYRHLVDHTTILARHFLKEGLPLLPNAGAGSPAVIELLTELEIPKGRGWSRGVDPLALALTLLPDDQSRRDHFVDYVRRAGIEGNRTERWGSLRLVRTHGMMHKRVKSGLRRVVRDDLSTGRLNRLAAGILADWGDAEMLPLLRQLASERGQQFAAKQIRMIEAQSPATRLLDITANGCRVFDERNRPLLSQRWALQRAIEWGLPRSEIVSAVEHYCALDIESAAWRQQAVRLKGAAVILGLISTTDIAAIPYNSGAPRTSSERQKQAAIWRWVRDGPNKPVPVNCEFVPYDAEPNAANPTLY